jgi:maltose alpha-D-glucosyltransferase/alpha-amylase
MQWSPDRNAGFSRADPQRLYLPPIMDSIYGYPAVNVEAQLREPSSLLNWMRKMLVTRKTSRAFGRGKLTLMRPGNRKILAYLRELGDEAILCVANLSRTAQPVELDLRRFKGRAPVELFGRTAFPPIGELPYLLTLPGSGFYWFKLSQTAEVPVWHAERLPREDLPVVILFDGWMSFFRDRVVPWRIAMAQKTRRQLEEEVLPRYLESQRWYAGKGEPVKAARIADHVVWERAGRSWMVAHLEVESATATVPYFLPLAVDWEDGSAEPAAEHAYAPSIIAKTRAQARVGVMADAFSEEAFCRALVEAIGAGAEIATAQGKLRFLATSAYASLAPEGLAKLAFTQPPAQSSNTIVVFGDRLLLKGYRRLRKGINPEFEVGRFLTEVARFPHCVPVAGALEYAGADGATLSLALLQGYASNQGDGWTNTLAYLERHFTDVRNHMTLPADVHGAYVALAHTLGQRTAELHRALTAPGGGAAFDPEAATEADLAAWKERVKSDAAATLEALGKANDGLAATSRRPAAELLERSKALLERIDAWRCDPQGVRKTRFHGDYHLGQVLVHHNDFVITDFEGEPMRSLEERRGKHSPLRDVAGMVRSFDYARWSALRRAATAPEGEERLAPLAEEWLQQAREAFLEAYYAAASGAGLYASPEQARTLVDLFVLEKALYELRYELANRPEWAEIPLRGILALADAS